MKFENTLQFAQQCDESDELKSFRGKFNIPEVNGKPSIYFTGNSLGAMPKDATKALNQELADWASLIIDTRNVMQGIKTKNNQVKKA